MSDFGSYRMRLFFQTLCFSILLSNSLLSGIAHPDQLDTLELQFQWVYPLSVADMKLVDFNFDGADEILVGFNSDSGRVGIVAPSDQTTIWRSSVLPGDVFTVAAGDRNGDGLLDVAGGGWTPGGYFGEGTLWIFDGPEFASVSTVGGLDQAATSVGIFRLGTSDTAMVVAGTRWEYDDDTYALVFWPFFTEGHLLGYHGAELSLSDSVRSGMVRTVDAIDVNGDHNPELISGEAHLRDTDYHGGYNGELDTLSIRVAYQENPLMIDVHVGNLYYDDFETHQEASLDALAAGNLLDGGTSQIVAGWRAVSGEGETRPANLSCFDAVTGDTIWAVADSVYPHYVSGLAICELSDNAARTVCAGYSDGTIRFKTGIDGSDVAVCVGLPGIYHFALGNVDQDNVTEICIASAGSLYVFEAPFISTDVQEAEEPSHLAGFSLHQNYPNPFNSATNIRFTVVQRGDVRLTIHNVLGECVRSFDMYCAPGIHSIIWDGKNSSGRDAASGVYLCRLAAGDYQEAKKMLLLR